MGQLWDHVGAGAREPIRAVIGLVQRVSPDAMANNGQREGTQAGSCTRVHGRTTLEPVSPLPHLSPGTSVFPIYLPCLEMGLGVILMLHMGKQRLEDLK